MPMSAAILNAERCTERVAPASPSLGMFSRCQDSILCGPRKKIFNVICKMREGENSYCFKDALR